MLKPDILFKRVQGISPGRFTKLSPVIDPGSYESSIVFENGAGV